MYMLEMPVKFLSEKEVYERRKQSSVLYPYIICDVLRMKMKRRSTWDTHTFRYLSALALQLEGQVKVYDIRALKRRSQYLFIRLSEAYLLFCGLSETYSHYNNSGSLLWKQNSRGAVLRARQVHGKPRLQCQRGNT